jgi:CBS domain-containing protein
MLDHGLAVASRDARVAGMLARLAALSDTDALIAAAMDLRALAFELLEDAESAAQLTRTIADLNDALTIRILESVRERHVLDGITFVWLALGSEGRREQTVHTDQDNAILFAAADIGAARDALRLFADEVNRLLDACGFPLCRGDIMARNPKWCLSVTEWQDCFARWIDTGAPEALLHGAIFFDFRGLWGELRLAAELRAWLSAYMAPRPVFLRQMTQNALQSRLPLGWFGQLRFERRAVVANSFDIKLQGAGLFTDAARILALSRGIAETATPARLLAWPRTDHERREAESWVEAFYTLQAFRLRRQLDCHRRGDALDNRIPAASLSGFDRRLLRACFEEARVLRGRIASEYGLAY